MTGDGFPDDLDYGQTIQIPRFGPTQKIFRRYTLQKILGRGGMGVVWLARDDHLETLVALKVLPEALSHDRASLDALKHETKLGLRLAHANIVRIYDFQQDDNAAAISMEYVDGVTFSDVRITRPEQVFNRSDLEPHLAALCDALNYAHTRGKIVHRDLKPRNLMLNSEGELKIADFGISRSISESMIMVTGKLGSSGSPPYISPQQWDGDRPSPLDDIYSVGATLYELLTSKPPLLGQVDWQQVHSNIPPPMWKRRNDLGVRAAAIPPEWEETIAACLAKDPKDRPQTIMELQARLANHHVSNAGAVEVTAQARSDDTIVIRTAFPRPPTPTAPVVPPPLPLEPASDASAGSAPPPVETKSVLPTDEEARAKAEADKINAERLAAERAQEQKAADEAKQAAQKAAEEEAKRVARQKAAEEEAKRVARQKAAEEEAKRVARQKAAEEESKRFARQKAAEEESKRVARQKAVEEEAKRAAEKKAAEEEAKRAEQKAADDTSLVRPPESKLPAKGKTKDESPITATQPSPPAQESPSISPAPSPPDELVAAPRQEIFPETATQPSFGTEVSPPSRRRMPRWVWAAAGAAILVLCGSFFIWRKQPPPAVTSSGVESPHVQSTPSITEFTLDIDSVGESPDGKQVFPKHVRAFINGTAVKLKGDGNHWSVDFAAKAPPLPFDLEVSAPGYQPAVPHFEHIDDLKNPRPLRLDREHGNVAFRSSGASDFITAQLKMVEALPEESEDVVVDSSTIAQDLSATTPVVLPTGVYEVAFQSRDRGSGIRPTVRVAIHAGALAPVDVPKTSRALAAKGTPYPTDSPVSVTTTNETSPPANNPPAPVTATRETPPPPAMIPTPAVASAKETPAPANVPPAPADVLKEQPAPENPAMLAAGTQPPRTKGKTAKQTERKTKKVSEPTGATATARPPSATPKASSKPVRKKPPQPFEGGVPGG